MTVETYSNLSIDEVIKIEQKYNVDLPINYKDFLLEYGGLYVGYPSYVEIAIDFLDDSTIAFESLFSIFTNNKYLDIFYINDEYLDELQEELTDVIIIGTDPGGNFYLLNCLDSQIYYWDRTHLHNVVEPNNKNIILKEEDNAEEYDSAYQAGNIYLLFTNFDSFLKLILSYVKDNNFKTIKSVRYKV